MGIVGFSYNTLPWVEKKRFILFLAALFDRLLDFKTPLWEYATIYPVY